MFTGLVQDIGDILECDSSASGLRLRIGTRIDLAREKIGASIACSGCCLTVVEKGDDWFSVEVSPESLSKTNIADWTVGRRINIEPSLRMGDELGGHFVFAHVDGLATLLDIENDEGMRRVKIAPPEPLMRFIASKGSVALDGVSLTVNGVAERHFDVTLIPHTWSYTVFQDRQVGDSVHIEIDMLARYAARHLEMS